MKKTLNNIVFFLFAASVTFTSCRTEETEIIEPPIEDNLTTNLVVASLMQKTSTNDGSKDNIIDKANCFNIKFITAH